MNIEGWARCVIPPDIIDYTDEDDDDEFTNSYSIRLLVAKYSTPLWMNPLLPSLWTNPLFLILIFISSLSSSSYYNPLLNNPFNNSLGIYPSLLIFISLFLLLLLLSLIYAHPPNTPRQYIFMRCIEFLGISYIMDELMCSYEGWINWKYLEVRLE